MVGTVGRPRARIAGALLALCATLIAAGCGDNRGGEAPAIRAALERLGEWSPIAAFVTRLRCDTWPVAPTLLT